MTYTVDKIFTKRLYETDCEVKEQCVYTEDMLAEWLELLHSCDYNVAYYKKEVVMFRHKSDYNDVFILYSKKPVTTEKLKKVFKFNENVVNIITVKEFMDALT